MKFEVEEYVNFPREEVYIVYRDHLPELVKFIPNAKKIEVKKREKKGTKTLIVNQWFGKYEIPKIARPYLKAEQITWLDIAEWDDEKYQVKWKFEPMFFKEQVKAEGVNYFFEDGDKTRILLTGEFSIDLSNYTLIPKLLRRVVAPQLEKFIFSLIKPNLVKVCRGVEKFLKEKEGK